MIFGHKHEQKFKYPYPRDSKIIQMPYPWAKAINQNPALCPVSPPLPPTGLTLIGALTLVHVNATVNFAQIVKKAICLMTTIQYYSNNSLTPEFK